MRVLTAAPRRLGVNGFPPKTAEETAGRHAGAARQFPCVPGPCETPCDARRVRPSPNRIEAHTGGLQQRRNIMSSKPTHTAFIVTDPKEGSDRKPVWHEVGAVWPHKNGEGFDLVIPAGLSVTGRIVCTKRKAPEPTA